MEALAIREMRDDEREAVAALWESCGLTRPWNDPAAEIALALAGPASTLLVGEVAGDAPAGLAASVMVGHDGHRGTVYYVSVAPACRGRGYGRQMMAAAEDWLKQRGIWKLNLLIRADNTAVEAFYASLGYAVEPRTAMAKWLDPSKNPQNAGKG